MPKTTLTAAALILIATSITGCSMHAKQTQTHDELGKDQQTTAINHMLFELSIQPSADKMVFDQPIAAGPQLVAGDWLAWQCALSGSYWDMPTQNMPVFAEASE